MIPSVSQSITTCCSIATSMDERLHGAKFDVIWSGYSQLIRGPSEGSRSAYATYGYVANQLQLTGGNWSGRGDNRVSEGERRPPHELNGRMGMPLSGGDHTSVLGIGEWFRCPHCCRSKCRLLPPALTCAFQPRTESGLTAPPLWPDCRWPRSYDRRYCARRIERLRPSLWRPSPSPSRSDF